MKLIFKSGQEFIKLNIERKEKRFEIATSTTNYRFIRQPFWKLFGTAKSGKPPTEEESKKEMADMELLDDGAFYAKLIRDMGELGYKRIK